jgi:UDP-N-acetylmuramate: L-alanyl-gamma-D-glutamyl-meso-diaminopimelate ligase
LRKRRPVVIAGTHGKTTTTALAAYLLDRAGLNPGFLIGGQPLDFAHSARLGDEGAPFVIEGDEYDTAFFDKRAKFFHYLPHVAVVTSIEFDHGDIYDDVESIERAFRLMLRQIPPSGRLILCADQPRALALRGHAFSHVTTYGFDESAEWRIADCSDNVATVMHDGVPWGDLCSPLPGRHNLLNTLAAAIVAHEFGADASVVSDALRAFRGVKRRMEVFLEIHGVTFVDDFAHHPTAIDETIRAARSRWPGRRLRVLFEPRSNTTVTNRFQQELADAFRHADEVWFGPIHREERLAPEMRLDRAALTSSLAEDGLRADYADDVRTIVDDVVGRMTKGDIVLILSNGAFGGIYDLLRKATASE